MDGMRVLVTATAARQVAIGRLQPYEQGLSIGLTIGFYRESFPEQGKRISIHSGAGFTAASYFFTLTRDEPLNSVLYAKLA